MRKMKKKSTEFIDWEAKNVQQKVFFFLSSFHLFVDDDDDGSWNFLVRFRFANRSRQLIESWRWNDLVGLARVDLLATIEPIRVGICNCLWQKQDILYRSISHLVVGLVVFSTFQDEVFVFSALWSDIPTYSREFWSKLLRKCHLFASKIFNQSNN